MLRKMSFFLMLMCCSLSFAQSYYYICKDRNYKKVEITEGLDLSAIDWNEIDSLTFSEPQFPPIITDGDTVAITYSGSSVSVEIPQKYIDVVSASVSGANVTLNSSASDTEIIYKLTGASTDGSFTFFGSYKSTFVLSGVSLTSTTGAAIDIECGKRIAIELAPGTVNTLCDSPSGSQKACLYTKGHIEFSKGGTLSVCGKANHAISSKEYILVKKTVGNITVSESANDGIHAGQYFKMNGGNVEIQSGVLGDGIQAEATKDSSDELNGQMIIAGGILTIDIQGDYTKCLKADSLFTITDGTLQLTHTGNSGVKPSGDDKQSAGQPSYKLYVSVPTASVVGGAEAPEDQAVGEEELQPTTGIRTRYICTHPTAHSLPPLLTK